VSNVGKTVAVAITDIKVEAGAMVAVSVDNRLNRLEKDVVEVPDKEARSKGGFPGEFGTAATEPICLPVTEGDVEAVRSEGDEGMTDVVVTGVEIPVATPCPTRLVEMACGLAEDTSAPCVELPTEVSEARYAAEDREAVYMEELV